MLLRKIWKAGLPNKRNFNQHNLSNKCRYKSANRLHIQDGAMRLVLSKIKANLTEQDSSHKHRLKNLFLRQLDQCILTSVLQTPFKGVQLLYSFNFFSAKLKHVCFVFLREILSVVVTLNFATSGLFKTGALWCIL